MRFETPSYWYRDENSSAPLSELLMTPVACVYGLAHKIHQAKKSVKADIPVLCVGNATAGGSGKTPVAIALSKLIQNKKLAETPYFLTRGYGGHLKGPVLAHPTEHDFKEVGDEALLLSGTGPVIVSENRALGATLASEDGADIIIMDDGLQNPGLHKDIKLVVINGEMGFGNGKLLPAGPLRSPLGPALEAADGFVLIGKDTRNIKASLPADKPVFEAQIQATKAPDTDKKYVAFAGLGYPHKFFDTLNTLGCTLSETVGFPDHYPYHPEDMKQLKKLAKEKGAELITTEKDFVRLPKGLDINVQTLPVELVWSDEAALVEFLKGKLS